MNKVVLKLLLIICVAMPMAAWATSYGFGALATNMMTPVGIVSDFVNSACIMIGGCFVFASIVKYFEHKRSPLMVTMSTVVFLFIAGIVLLLLPFIYVLSQGGNPLAGFNSLVQ